MILGVSIMMAWVFSDSLVQAGQGSLTQKYDHDMHLEKVFKVNEIGCDYCHNVEKDSTSGDFKLNNNIGDSTFKKPIRQICHECHQSTLATTSAAKTSAKTVAKYEKAPKSCLTCHNSPEKMTAIKPISHQSPSWKFSHAIKTSVDGQSCSDCHSNSQCVKCHAQRNDLSSKNHSKNYKFFHSIEARMSPQKCDVCHSKTYCTTCHMGGVK